MQPLPLQLSQMLLKSRCFLQRRSTVRRDLAAAHKVLSSDTVHLSYSMSVRHAVSCAGILVCLGGCPDIQEHCCC